MNRTSSPISEHSETQNASEWFNESSSRAFTKLKDTLQKNTINTGDAILALIQWSGNDPLELIDIFCLANFMLLRSKHRMNEISPNSYEKLNNKLIETFHEKSDQLS
tara:strand:+ start:1395 stop:1715 length:321 start_codon:yes stop_codon:yes gene_type:complete